MNLRRPAAFRNLKGPLPTVSISFHLWVRSGYPNTEQSQMLYLDARFIFITYSSTRTFS